MCLKHCKYCTEFIFSCFLPDGLPRATPDLDLGGFGWILEQFGRLLTSIWGSGGRFFGDASAPEFRLDF